MQKPGQQLKHDKKYKWQQKTNSSTKQQKTISGKHGWNVIYQTAKSNTHQTEQTFGDWGLKVYRALMFFTAVGRVMSTLFVQYQSCDVLKACFWAASYVCKVVRLTAKTAYNEHQVYFSHRNSTYSWIITVKSEFTMKQEQNTHFRGSEPNYC